MYTRTTRLLRGCYRLKIKMLSYPDGHRSSPSTTLPFCIKQVAKHECRLYESERACVAWSRPMDLEEAEEKLIQTKPNTHF